MATPAKVMFKFTQDEFRAKAIELYGDDPMNWKFRCPNCGVVTAAREWKMAGAPQGAIGFSCIGRYVKSEGVIGNGKQPCDYTIGGLFVFSEMLVDGDPFFALAGL